MGRQQLIEERFREATPLINELRLAGYLCHFAGPYSASFSITNGKSWRGIRFGYSGYRWWVDKGLGSYYFSDFEELREDIMRWVRDE